MSALEERDRLPSIEFCFEKPLICSLMFRTDFLKSLFVESELSVDDCDFNFTMRGLPGVPLCLAKFGDDVGD